MLAKRIALQCLGFAVFSALAVGMCASHAQAQSRDLIPAEKKAGHNPDPWPKAKRLLFIADVQTGYHHDAINHTMGVVEEMGRATGAYITVLRTDSQMITDHPIPPQGKYVVDPGRASRAPAIPGDNPINSKALSYFDAVFLLPSGYGTMDDAQKKALIDFVRSGKGLIVGHASGAAFVRKDGSLTWPEWGYLIGGMMDRRPGHSGEFRANAKVIVEDTKFPGAMSWGKTSFMFDEQHPLEMPPYYSRKTDDVILRLDPASLPEQYRKQHPDGDFPVVWARQEGKGRVFNVGWGEFESTWDDEGFRKLMLGGIKWALGSAPADITPRPLPKPNMATN